jgi:mono/diheme cytochrome c family protein
MTTNVLRTGGLALLVAALAISGGARLGLADDDNGTAAAKPPPITAEMLADSANIEIGRAIWDEQCTHCHGANAYPGKAPKLRPSRYRPEWVYHRVANGFRGMPAWGELYTTEEIIGVVAYVKSKQFSP